MAKVKRNDNYELSLLAYTGKSRNIFKENKMKTGAQRNHLCFFRRQSLYTFYIMKRKVLIRTSRGWVTDESGKSFGWAGDEFWTSRGWAVDELREESKTRHDSSLPPPWCLDEEERAKRRPLAESERDDTELRHNYQQPQDLHINNDADKSLKITGFSKGE